MKVHLFKNLIKEAVREVLKEELRDILSEYKSSTPFHSFEENTTLSSTSKDLKGKPTTSTPISSLESVLNETRQSMTSSDFKNMIGGDIGVSSISGTPSTSINETSDIPTVGLDITNLSFVKKAAAVYNLANEKSNR